MIKPDIISPSPHFYYTPFSRMVVVIHSTRSGISMNPSEFKGTLNWFANPASEVSSHWVISREGVKARVVADSEQAWHAGEHNDCLSVEFEQGVESDGFTDIQLAAGVLVCAAYCKDFGVPARHITDITQDGFIGHEETPQGKRTGKSDPGNLFPWDAFIAHLQEAIAPPAELPSNEEAAHAIGFLYAAYYRKEQNFMHPFDRDIIRRISEWLNE